MSNELKPEQVQGDFGRTVSDWSAGQILPETKFLDDGLHGRGKGDVHQSDRFAGRRARGPSS